ncbi:MAG TPA: hypothetical protein VM077_02215 [Candidatus Limnocylindrales bacterium]|nr:hypothetical protein [Candidatus Limnocylindrales bacterium]
MKKSHYKSVLRIIHFVIVIYLVSGIAYIYYSAYIQQTSYLLYVFIISLFIEGLVIFLNRGNCPFGYLQKLAGDYTPFFELILPKKYAKSAVRFFAIITLIGIILLDFRMFF